MVKISELAWTHTTLTLFLVNIGHNGYSAHDELGNSAEVLFAKIKAATPLKIDARPEQVLEASPGLSVKDEVNRSFVELR